MKSGKQRSGKAGSSKKKEHVRNISRKVPSDVSPSTSLPPLVEGQLRCFLQVTISRILWTVHKPPSATFVRLRWWGESSNGTHFFPRDGSQLSQKTIKDTAHFPIRCGPKQFTSYLTDMGSLVLEVLTKPDHWPVARAQVPGISRLSLSHPISGFYNLVSPTSEKLGEIQLSLNLEPLTEAYDSSSSGPCSETPQLTTLIVPSRPRSLSAGSSRDSAGSSSINTPRGKDHLYFQKSQTDKQESIENEVPNTNRSQNSQMSQNPSSQQPSGQTTSDILSAIIERGNKLRNAMADSALKCDIDCAQALKDTPLPLPKDNILVPSNLLPSPSGMFLQNILHADSSLKHSDDVAANPDCGLGCPADMDNRAVELLLGSANTSPLPLWAGDSSLLQSLSGLSSVCGDSELNDPQYDQSLLENLFYKTPMSDSQTNDTDGECHATVAACEKQLTQSRNRISVGLNPEPEQSADALPSGLSAEQLTVLSPIRLARVTVDSLTVPGVSTPRTGSSKGKPPRPFTSNKCTYFIEYVFPTVSASSRGRSGVGEVTRAVASKVAGGVVKFHQRSAFPVHLSTATVKQWWETDLIFKIHSRKSSQKKPVPVGKAVYPLCRLLQSKLLSQSVVLPVQSMEGNLETQGIGPLKVSLELVTDNKDVPSEPRKSKLASRDTSPSQTAHSPQRGSSPRVHVEREDGPSVSLNDSRLHVWTPQKPSKEPAPHPSVHKSPCKLRQPVEEVPEVLLHALLMVPDGKNFSCGALQAPNLYLNCKLFWCDETARSVVSWGQTNPSFNFSQVTPVALTDKLLERMKNNMMVIEVWLKKGSPGQDQLLGLVKLPLHQFYMSFRDPKISHLLLQAQYPVLGVDCYMPVIDVFSGSCRGNLRVVLAMGRSEQIVSLQRTRDEEFDSVSRFARPVHLLDHQPQTKAIVAQEHVFVIRVEKVNGLTPLQSTVWGEADCYVQYSFPCQESDAATKLDQSLIESSVNLKAFRTTTTLCVPDPLFGHTETHVLVAPEGVPVQRLLLSSLSSQGLSSGGGVQFEVWCRYYYPNVRDQLVARGMLPLSKLCAMVTMQRQHPNESQMFSLPLIPRSDSPPGHQPQPSGLLDVSIRYKHRPVRSESQTSKGAASRVVTLAVQVHRASGLQAAARVVSQQDERFGYFAAVGVNTFVTVQLSILPESEKRSTRIVARTFCPEFDHHMEMSCDLLLQRNSGETSSLAEQLEGASAVFTVWNRDNRKAALIQAPKDVMLGVVKVPLADLIHKRTGISGWFGVYASQDSTPQKQVLVAGLEVSVGFAHHSDRERVIKAAQGVGWEVAQSEEQDDEAVWEHATRSLSLTVSMPRAWIPVHCLLLPGLQELQRSTYCYFRYKFYDQDAYCSQMKHPAVEAEDEGQATVTFQGSRTVELRNTQPLMWYLREEKLEVQVWVAFKKDKAQRPTDTDRLVGSAFIDLSSLAKTPKHKLTLSGVYPLFRRSAEDLQGAALRVHITLMPGFVPEEDTQLDSDNQGELLSEEVDADVPLPSTPRSSHRKNRASRTTPDITSVQHAEMDDHDSFPVTVAVDRAMHLSLKSCPLTERSEGSPCCCVSYVTADSVEPVSTSVIGNTDCPVWDHEHECRLSKELLVDTQQYLVFKVWHKGEVERVIGFASVDLSPLLCGFPSVCGWYNITDFSGQCHGQLKVSVTPLRGLQDLRGQRKPVNEKAAKNSPALFQTFPLTYHTTASYSSFPAHISRFTEQKISSPEHADRLFTESESDRHCEHMDKVRLYHQSLQEQTAAQSVGSSSSTCDLDPSSSVLFSALRKKLSELDNIQRYFSHKLSTPTFPSVSEQECQPRPEEQSASDMSQLLLKSNQLVGEVDNIISGLRGHHLETIPSVPKSSSATLAAEDNNPQTIPEKSLRIAENSSSSHRTSSSPEERVRLFPLPTLLTKTAEDDTDSEAEEAEIRPNVNVSETEDEEEDMTGVRQIEEAVDDEDEDFEEVVVKPRALNEVTSLTDKTSPWTSVLSEPDLVSLESLEAPEMKPRTLNEVTSLTDKTSPWTSVLSEPDLVSLESLEAPEEPDQSQDEGEKLPALNLQSDDQRQEESDTSEISEGHSSDSDSEHERILQAVAERREVEASRSEEESCDEDSPPSPQHPADTQDASCSPDQEDALLHPSVPVEVPNFFLPSHQLEASMRAIRLAPSFSQATPDPERRSALLPRRVPRQRDDMSPSSKRKETERIAKIFSAHFHS